MKHFQQSIFFYEFIILIIMLISFFVDIIKQLQQPGLIIQMYHQDQLLYQTKFIIIFILKILNESTRINIILIVLTNIMLLLSKILSHQNRFVLSITLILLILTFLSIVLLPVYKLPKLTGQYAVGYKNLNSSLSFYYPVDKFQTIHKHYQKQIKFLRVKDFKQFIHQTNSTLPPIFLQLILGFLTTITIPVLVIDIFLILFKQVDGPIIEDHIIPIYFIVDSQIDLYNYYCMEWASQGYSVYISQNQIEIPQSHQNSKQKIIVMHGRVMQNINKNLLNPSESQGIVSIHSNSDQVIKHPNLLQINSIDYNANKQYGLSYNFPQLTKYYISDLALFMPSELNIFFNQSISTASFQLYPAIAKLTTLFFDNSVQNKNKKCKYEEIKQEFKEYVERSKMKLQYHC